MCLNICLRIQGNLLSPQDFVNLRNCNQQYPNCKHKVGMLTTTYAEDSNGKTLIIFEVTDIKKQGVKQFLSMMLLTHVTFLYFKSLLLIGCWGYLLQFSDNLEMKNIYFNFDNEVSFFFGICSADIKVYVILDFDDWLTRIGKFL